MSTPAAPRRNALSDHPAQPGRSTLEAVLRDLVAASPNYRLEMPASMHDRYGAEARLIDHGRILSVAEFVNHPFFVQYDLRLAPATLSLLPVRDLLRGFHVGSIIYYCDPAPGDAALPQRTRTVITLVYQAQPMADLVLETKAHNDRAVRLYHWGTLATAARAASPQQTTGGIVTPDQAPLGEGMVAGVADELPQEDGAGESLMVSSPQPGVRVLSRIGHDGAPDPDQLTGPKQLCDLCGYAHRGGVWVAVNVTKLAVQLGGQAPDDLTLASLVYLAEHLATQAQAEERQAKLGMRVEDYLPMVSWTLAVINNWAMQLIQCGIGAAGSYAPAAQRALGSYEEYLARVARFHRATAVALGLDPRAEEARR